jgi:hypothetical protein
MRGRDHHGKTPKIERQGKSFQQQRRLGWGESARLNRHDRHNDPPDFRRFVFDPNPGAEYESLSESGWVLQRGATTLASA